MSVPDPVFRFRFRERLDRFDLDVALESAAPYLGVFGVSGSGKTTLLECIAGLRTGAAGEIAFFEQTWLDTSNGRSASAASRGIGYAPQDHLLFPHLSVQENLVYGKNRPGKTNTSSRVEFEDVVSVLELDALLDRSVVDLSGGEKQRVSLGRALCSNPQLLLLDEPMAALDAGLRRRILTYLVRVRERFAIPMIVVSHNPIELQTLCEEVLVLESGSVVESGRPNAVFTRPGVFAAAKRSGFENVLTGRVANRSGSSSLDPFELEGGGCCIHIPKTDVRIGDVASISIASDDILIGIEEPMGLSARNRIKATIERIEDLESHGIVHARIDDASAVVAVEITQESIESLALTPGKAVYLVFKSSSVSILCSR